MDNKLSYWQNPVAGIYKITSPSGRVYIGQSVHIYKRWSAHRRIKKYHDTQLHRSLSKYGAKRHLFEIIHELPKDVSINILNTYESLYIEMYKYSGYNLLNGNSGGRNRIPTSETRNKLGKHRLGISPWNKGKQWSCEVKEKLKLARSKQILIPLPPEIRKEIGRKNSIRYKGEGSITAILTEKQVLEIRAKYIRRVFTAKMIANEYGIKKDHVTGILLRRSWKHI